MPMTEPCIVCRQVRCGCPIKWTPSGIKRHTTESLQELVDEIGDYPPEQGLKAVVNAELASRSGSGVSRGRV